MILQCFKATKKAAAGAKNKKFELTEEQKQEIREAFDLFDTDGSGRSLFRMKAALETINTLIVA